LFFQRKIGYAHILDREAKIDQLECGFVGRQADVLGLDVAVHNVEGVHVRDGRAQLVDVLQGPVPAPKIRDNGVEEVSAPDVFLWCTCQRKESGSLLI
jgi:hypothetical protein